MHRFRSWTLDPPEYRTQRNRLLPIEGGDGSTLNLDFTTGVLDSRLSFSRTSDATFINSSGLVQYADANLMARSETLDASPWSLGGVTNTEEQITNPIGGNSCRLVTVSTSGGSKSIVGGMTIAQGFQYTFRVWVRAGTSSSVSLGYYLGSFQNSTLTKVSGPGTISGSGSGATYHTVNGLTSNWTLLQLTLASTTTSGIGGWYIYPNTPSNAIGNSIYVWGAQANIGAIANPYYTTTANPYYAPRFDHNPTTGSPRGLLIEGSATNSVFRSQTLNNTLSWNRNGANVSISITGSGSPANDSTSNVLTWANSTPSGNAWLEQSLTVAGTQAYTWSVWLKPLNNQRIAVFGLTKNSSNTTIGNIETTVNFSVSPPTATNTVTSGYTSVTTPTLTEYPNGWYRMVMTGTTPATAATTTFGISNKDNVPSTGTNGCEVWGPQFEAGSGASSYIPTGASQGSRAYDHCYATGANFNSWFSVGAGTMVVVSDNIKNNSQNLSAMISDDSLNNYIRMGFKVGGASNEYLLTTVGGPSSFQGTADSGYAPPLNTVYRMAYAWDTNNFGIVANGGAVVTDSSGTLAGAGVLTRLVVGGDFVAVPNDIYFKNGHIRSLKYWPTRLPNAQLQSLTT